MIRKCEKDESGTILEVINDSASAYEGVIPADLWTSPYMSGEYLAGEIGSGVVFWGFYESGKLLGVMGIQDLGEVVLFRHAYVLTAMRGRGIGTALLKRLYAMTDRPVLIGTWADASWAVAFYLKNGFRIITGDEKDGLLQKYWRLPARQVETSVVMADCRYAG
ncbi:MAG: GNAT family N-acetyltransferase [Spirochaetes bacterium]|jgi:GNAT superfamily N-acetyltransferase|nr:GNAT family N-acetyltransferase [Spirochaetota bacterium]